MRPASRPEDTPKTLIFVDILGFEAITKLHKVRVQDFGPDEHGFSGSSTTEMPNRINRFNSFPTTRSSHAGVAYDSPKTGTPLRHVVTHEPPPNRYPAFSSPV